MIGSSLDDIARSYNISDVLQAYGVKVGRGTILCPLPMHTHHNNTPSMSIRKYGDRQRFTCFGNCGKEGDVIDLVGYMEIPGYDPSDLSHRIQAAEKLTGEKFTKPAEVILLKDPPKLDQNTWKWFLPIGSEVTEYAVKRGIDPWILDEFRIGSASHVGEVIEKKGFENLMAIPTFHNNNLQGVKIRIINPGKLRFFAVVGSQMGLFNHDEVMFDTGRILVAKGEIPAMVLIPEGRKNGFKVCAISGSENADISTSEHILRALAFGNKVLVGDNDKNPETDVKMKAFARKRAELLGAKLRFPPTQYKDLDEWYLSDYDAVATILKWFEEKE